MRTTEALERFRYSGNDPLSRETLPDEDAQLCLTEAKINRLDNPQK